MRLMGSLVTLSLLVWTAFDRAKAEEDRHDSDLPEEDFDGASPSFSPSAAPITALPTTSNDPTMSPTNSLVVAPSMMPSLTIAPSNTLLPTVSTLPSATPTTNTQAPTNTPTNTPSLRPSAKPTQTVVASEAPTTVDDRIQAGLEDGTRSIGNDDNSNLNGGLIATLVGLGVGSCCALWCSCAQRRRQQQQYHQNAGAFPAL